MVNLVGLDIDASTTKDFTEPEHSLLLLGSPFAWRFISSDGTLSNSMLGSCSSENCLPSEQLLPNKIGQGLRAHGIVVMDVPSTDGSLLYSEGPSNGWEYPLSRSLISHPWFHPDFPPYDCILCHTPEGSGENQPGRNRKREHRSSRLEWLPYNLGINTK